MPKDTKNANKVVGMGFFLLGVYFGVWSINNCFIQRIFVKLVNTKLSIMIFFSFFKSVVFALIDSQFPRIDPNPASLTNYANTCPETFDVATVSIVIELSI